MGILSSPIERIRAHYTAVVVGSGYGGSIAASRLARAGQSICLLERGRELQPGEYPNTAAEAVEQFQVSGPDGHLGSPTGLYDLRVHEGMSVFLGCGLGGTSLVNANVALRAEPRVFRDPRWPAELRAGGSLDDFYGRALEMLEPAAYPENHPPLAKLAALQASSQAMGARFYRPPINVTFADRVNRAGVRQPACTLCGDCVSGCNPGSKNTLIMNYLPDAVDHGAEIYTGTSARWLERRDGRWIVHYRLLESGRGAFDAPDMFVSADVVVLSAGTLGSTEILLRSRQRGLPLSDRLGHRFTGNGDVLAFGYNTSRHIDGVGHGHHDPAGRAPVGPCITGIVDLREQPELAHGMVIEEGSMPGALARFLPETLAAIAHGGVNTASGLGAHLRQRERELESMVLGPYTGAVRNTQTYLVMTHDQDAGLLRLEDDRVVVEWDRVGDEHIFELVDERLRSATAAIEGVHVRDPLWSRLAGDSLITVHPLGGCVMGDDAAAGVVDGRQRVYAGKTGQDVHEGLYVTDGSVVPCPLGVNPLLTISALSERAMALLGADRGWRIDYSLPATPAPRPQRPPAAVGIEFTERMAGWYSGDLEADYEPAAELGRRQGSSFSFTLTIVSEDLAAMLRDPEHAARMTGTVSAPRLSPSPLQVVDGVFNLFVADPADQQVKRMRYRMRLVAEDGRAYLFEGFKLMRESGWNRLWPDTTTLYVTLTEDGGQRPLGKGVLTIAAEDFARQMTTMRALNARGEAERLEALARFGSTFAGVLFHSYGGIHLGGDPAAPQARKKRELRLPAPEVHTLTAPDGGRSLLTRYPNPDGTPVLLVPGARQSTLIFTLDTLATTLAEYLWLDRREVWLLDHRGSPRLTGHPGGEAGGLAADVGAAVERIRQVTGAPRVAVLGHGIGASALLLAALEGERTIGAAVCSQNGLPLAAASEPQHLERLAFPIGFVEAGGGPGDDGAASAAATFQLLRAHNGGDGYAHLVVRGYHGDDCITGVNSPRDVYRWLADHLALR